MADILETMTSEQYISERVIQYQTWYDKKAVQAKSKYLNMRAASVVGAALVPVIVNLPIAYVNYVATVISLVVVMLVSLESVYHFGDQWKNYRSTEQYLGREKILFATREGPYRGLDGPAAFLLFVERCENQISAENSATLNLLSVAPQQRESGDSGKH